MIPDFEYLDELDYMYEKEKQLKEAKNWVKNLDKEKIKYIIENTNVYNRDSSIKMDVFFHEFADEIFKSKIG